jgi:hypothetical protein
MNSNASATTTTTATNNNIGHKDYNGTHENETKELPEQLPAQQNSNSKSIIILLVIFSTSLLAMVYIYMMFPELEE